MNDLITTTFFSILAAGFFVGIVVGLTGHGRRRADDAGADLPRRRRRRHRGDRRPDRGGDLQDRRRDRAPREGSPNLQLAKWLIIGSVPMALLGPWLIRAVADPSRPRRRAQALHRLRAAVRGVDVRAAALHQPAPGARRRARTADPNPHIRPIPTLLVGALGGLLVGITSVGSGSVIMIALLMLYPGLSAVKLVGTDLVQAVPLVLAAAISNIALHGLDWTLLIPLVIGSVPGTILGSKIAPRVPQSVIRRGIVVVLTMSGVALLDKAGWAPLGAGEDETHPMLIAGVGLAMLVLVPLIWGLLRKTAGPAHVRLPDGRRARGPGLQARDRRDEAAKPASATTRVRHTLGLPAGWSRSPAACPGLRQPGRAGCGPRRASSAPAARARRGRRRARRAARCSRRARRGAA